jgi:hypothetical protein
MHASHSAGVSDPISTCKSFCDIEVNSSKISIHVLLECNLSGGWIVKVSGGHFAIGTLLSMDKIMTEI